MHLGARKADRQDGKSRFYFYLQVRNGAMGVWAAWAHGQVDLT